MGGADGEGFAGADEVQNAAVRGVGQVASLRIALLEGDPWLPRGKMCSRGVAAEKDGSGFWGHGGLPAWWITRR